jgi:hypothetical protein
MDVDDLLDWLTWGVITFTFVAMVLAALALIVIGIAEIIYHLRRRKCTDQLLASIPDVPYKELPPPADGGAAGTAADDDRCVICQEAYEVDERCSVLPRCDHMFRRQHIIKKVV